MAEEHSESGVTWDNGKSPGVSTVKCESFLTVKIKWFVRRQGEADNQITKGSISEVKCYTYPALISKKTN